MPRRSNYLTSAVSKKKTAQSQPIPGTTQVANSAGGFSWAVTPWQRLERFLILGAEGGTYYITERKLTLENAKCVEVCLKEDAARTIATIAAVSGSGRAPKNDPALFALAICISKGDLKAKQMAAAVLPTVARIGTHLFHFADFASAMRGWGPLLRKAVADWYLAKSEGQLAYQLVKYQSRDGWSHRDLLRLSHPKPVVTELHKQAFAWAVGKEPTVPIAMDGSLRLIGAFEDAKTADETRTVQLIHDYNLPRECIRTELLKSPAVWDALLVKMPLTAMIRNLGNMTAIGLVAPNSAATAVVLAKLSSQEALKKARIHPLQVFLADATYRQGHGTKGSNNWTPVTPVRDALEDAFYKTFEFVEPTEKRWFLGLDVSGSMTSSLGSFPITCREASALLAMVTMRTEKQYFIGGFTSGGSGRYLSYSYGRSNAPFTPLEKISPKMKLEQVRDAINDLDFGGTDCAQPMLYAMAHKIPADVFVIYTDSETWAGDIHPTQALKDYRQKMGIDARLVVVGMTSNGFTIADPNDAGMLDVVGFDTTVPRVLSDFVAPEKAGRGNDDAESQAA